MELLILWFIIGAITGFIAGKKGYNTLVCIVLALAGLIGLLVAVVLPKRN